jgi:NifU-like protein involved in Fe-S cluster formation
MTEYYKGERVADLLQRIEELKAVLDENAHLEPDPLRIVTAYADLAIAKAKFTALQGEKE